MKLSTLLLSSAALVVAGSAYAADLPAKKGAPAAKAVAGCPAFGAGFWQIPGTDTCLALSGFVRSNNQYVSNTARGTNPSTLAGAYRINVDARNNSEAGVVRSLIRVEGGATSRAFVQLGGLTAGAADNPLDLGLGYNYSGQQFGGSGIGMVSYSVPVGSGSFVVGITQPRDQNGRYRDEILANDGTTNGSGAYGARTQPSASRPDVVAAFTTTAGALSMTVGAASHETVGQLNGEAVAAGATATSSGQANGYALISNVSTTLGSVRLTGYAAYAQGAAAYLGGSEHIAYIPDSNETAGDLSSGNNYAAQIDIALGAGSVGLYAGRVNIKQGANETKESQYAISYSQAIAKGLTIRPELIQTTTDDATENRAYIRIQRDF